MRAKLLSLFCAALRLTVLKTRSLCARRWGFGRPWELALAGMLLIAIAFYLLNLVYSRFGIVQEQYVGWGCFLAILVAHRSRRFHRQPWRMVFIMLAAFLALRYIQWRTLHTLIYTGPLDFLGMALLYLAEVYGLVVGLLGMFVNFSPKESAHVPLPEDRSLLPTVDVLIPTYNEPIDIIRVTATAAAQIDYPKEKLRIYILDDGGTQAKRSHPEHGVAAWERHYTLRRMAADLGVGYITRETNQRAKAGNLNHALHHTEGELLLILDCDHVPTKDILQNTVGQFLADPKLFLVQTPHFFINPTPVDRNLEGGTRVPGENDMFYRRIHPALNFWNASYFCGSAALLRRKYLLEVGGICGSTITEDAETSFNLHSRGYNSVYVNRPMVCGLSPESYDDYVTQRSRWAQGMVQLVLLYHPLRSSGLSLAQKFAYLNSSVFWFFGIPRFIYFIAPACYLIFGLNVYHASGVQVLAFTLPYVLSIYLVMGFFYGGSRQILFSEIYESVQSLFLIPAVISVLLNPGKPSFRVTPKGLTNERNYLSPLAVPFLVVIAINVLAAVLAGIKWFAEPWMHDMILVTSVWTVYNLYLALMSLGAFWERRQVRKFYRIAARGPVTAHFPRLGTSHEGEVHDVSLTGIGLAIELPFAPDPREEVVLEVRDSYGRTYRFECRIHRAAMRQGRYFCGTEFDAERISYDDAVSYVFGDSQRWQDNWNRQSQSRGGWATLWRFFISGVKGVSGGIPMLWERMRRLTRARLRDKLLAVASRCVYYACVAGGIIVELLDRRQVRTLQRSGAGAAVTVQVPRMNAALAGVLVNLSLSGAGILADLPFDLQQGERVTIRAQGRDGKEHQLDCAMLRMVRGEAASFFGVAFTVDAISYPRIVRFVYGNDRLMLYQLLAAGSAPPANAGTASSRLVIRLLRGLARALAVLFLNPAYRAGLPRQKKIHAS